MSELTTLAAFASLGLLSLPHCLVMCGPLAAKACMGSSGVDAGEAGAYVAGRTASYLFLGAAAGTIGATALGEWGRSAAVVLVELAAIALFVQGVHRLFPTWALPVFMERRLAPVTGLLRFVPSGGLPLGLATGFLPCGVLAVALALALASGSPTTGALGMAVFALTGAPALVLPVLLFAGGGRRLPVDPNVLSRVTGAAMILLALFVAARPFAGPTSAADDAHCATVIQEAAQR